MAVVPVHPEPEVEPTRYPQVINSILSFRGVVCDELENVLQIPLVLSIRMDLHPLFEGMKMLETSMARNPCPTDEDVTTVAWRTLVGNRDGAEQNPPEE